MNSLAGQVAVVLGASSGIGRAIALALAEHGANLCLVGRSSETLQAVADRVGGRSRVFCLQLDLAQDSEVDRMGQRVLGEFDGVDILVHSAGINRLAPIESTTPDELDYHTRVNFRSAFLITRQLLPTLRSRHGQVLFVNSSAGLTAGPNVAQYAANKHALKALADSLRQEVNPDGVRVTSLFLGRTASPGQAAIHAMEGRSYRPELLMQPEDVAIVALQALTLPRSAEVTDIRMRALLKSY